VLAIAGLTAGLLAASGGGGPAPRARSYLAFTACLLTNPQGLASPQAAAAWAGLENASATTRAKVQYLAVPPGTTTAASARPYLASLLLRKCSVVVATGPAQVAAVDADARQFGSVKFAVAGGHASAANVTAMPASPGAVRSAVTALVTAAAG
jgi:basic membrane lipoprotein Med (substrate-binding protein (PBP1-ABC) superfamily)